MFTGSSIGRQLGEERKGGLEWLIWWLGSMAAAFPVPTLSPDSSNSLSTPAAHSTLHYPHALYRERENLTSLQNSTHRPQHNLKLLHANVTKQTNNILPQLCRWNTMQRKKAMQQEQVRQSQTRPHGTGTLSLIASVNSSQALNFKSVRVLLPSFSPVVNPY